MKKYKFNESDSSTTKFGKWLENIYAVSKNEKIRILHPVGFPLYLFTLIFTIVVDILDIEYNNNRTKLASVKYAYNLCKDIYEIY